jgi:hypothetical protein
MSAAYSSKSAPAVTTDRYARIAASSSSTVATATSASIVARSCRAAILACTMRTARPTTTSISRDSTCDCYATSVSDIPNPGSG